MAHLIDKSALVAEIERQISAIDNCPKLTDTQIAVLEGNKEENIENDFGSFWGDYIDSGGDMNNYEVARHFFELGLKTQRSSIDIPNIDDIFEEDGIDPNSKAVKIFKESYYMALEKFKAQKREDI